MNEQIERYEAFTYAATETQSETIQPAVITESDSTTVVGYAVVWGAVSDIRKDGYRHTFQRGSIQWAPVVNALFAHLSSIPLGSTANQTLEIVEDDYGAKTTIKLDDTTDGINAFKRVKSRLLRGMSFGGTRYAFQATDDPQIILVTKFIANEVTLTIDPAMTETAIVTEENISELEKETQLRLQKQKLDSFKLSLLKPRQSIGLRRV